MIDQVEHKPWLINNFEEIGWLDPDNEDMNNYNGRQPMVNHPFDVPAYEDNRFFKESPPNMIYLPSVELT